MSDTLIEDLTNPNPPSVLKYYPAESVGTAFVNAFIADYYVVCPVPPL